MRKALAVAMLSVVLIASANAGVYVWKDSGGKTVYSDQMPTGPVVMGPVTQLTIKVLPGAKRQEASAALGVPDNVPQVSQKQTDSSEKSKKVARQRQENCLRAKGNQNMVQVGGRIRFIDDQGKQQYMDDKNRPDLLRRAEQDVVHWCK